MSVSIMNPVPDRAEWNAFFPSPYSLALYTGAKTDFDGAVYEKKYTGHQKILVVLTEERYLAMTNGRLFSTGNHPVETLLPLMHLAGAGFSFDIATLSGNRAKLEQWAMPLGDAAVMKFYESILPQLESPENLDGLMGRTGLDGYAAVFIPGGHGVLAGIPQSPVMGQMLHMAMKKDLFIISICHGPASFLAAAGQGSFLFEGYEICAFPDAMDEGANVDIGYLPGHLGLLAAGELKKRGVRICNEGISGQVRRDRNLLTGDSPLASNALGRLAAETMLQEV